MASYPRRLLWETQISLCKPYTLWCDVVQVQAGIKSSKCPANGPPTPKLHKCRTQRVISALFIKILSSNSTWFLVLRNGYQIELSITDEVMFRSLLNHRLKSSLSNSCDRWEPQGCKLKSDKSCSRYITRDSYCCSISCNWRRWDSCISFPHMHKLVQNFSHRSRTFVRTNWTGFGLVSDPLDIYK
jgi:hypothetical protein